MAIFERGETYTHWANIRDRDNDYTDPNTVTITIEDPCGYAIVSNQNMIKSTVGKYYYNYDNISSTATYGKYVVTVTANSGAGQIGIQKDEFYVMPWKLERDVRQITGISDTKSITDDDLSDICWKAYLEAHRDAFTHHYKESPGGNPDTGVGVNGSNVAFQTKNYPIADIGGDGTVNGNNVSCSSDVIAWWLDDSGSRQRAIVTISNAANGEVSIYQDDASTAIPSTYEGLYLDYWSEYGSFDTEIFRNAVSHLAADYLTRRMSEADRVTIGDLNSNKPILVKNEYRFYNKYRQIINRVRKPRIGGV